MRAELICPNVVIINPYSLTMLCEALTISSDSTFEWTKEEVHQQMTYSYSNLCT